MNAKEARTKAQKINEQKRQKEYAEVKALISEAVDDGAYKATFYGHLRRDVKENLESEGYKISEKMAGMNEIDTEITW